jgi:hypothetical protein
VAHIVGGTVGSLVGLILVTAILFLLCRRRRNPPSGDRAGSGINEKLEKEPSTSESHVAIRGSNDPSRKLGGTLPTIHKGSGLSGSLSSSAPVQAANGSDVRPSSDKIPQLSTSSSGLQREQNVASLFPETPLCAFPDQRVSEAPIPFAINSPSDDGGEGLVLSSAIESLPTGGEATFPSRSFPASQRDLIATSLPETPFSASTDAQLSEAPMRAIELPSLADPDSDVELPLTYAMESHPTASEAIFHPDTLIPTTTVEKLNDWTETSKVVFSIDIGTSHSVRFLLLKVIASFLP